MQIIKHFFVFNYKRFSIHVGSTCAVFVREPFRLLTAHVFPCRICYAEAVGSHRLFEPAFHALCDILCTQQQRGERPERLPANGDNHVSIRIREAISRPFGKKGQGFSVLPAHHMKCIRKGQGQFVIESDCLFHFSMPRNLFDKSVHMTDLRK